MKRKSTVEQIREDQKPVEKQVAELATTVEEDEKALLLKLKKKYENEEVNGPKIPGQRVRGEKVPWTYSEILKRFPIVDFIPEETIPLTWNGVKVQARSGVEMHVPKPFHDLYKQHMAAQRPQKAPPGILVELGAGALEPR